MNTLRVIEDKLILCGANPSLSGFYCAMHAINYFIENNKEFYQASITHDVYPYVANKIGVKSASRVERNIRHLVEDMFDRECCLRGYAKIESGKMTNAHFVSYMLLIVKRDLADE